MNETFESKPADRRFERLGRLISEAGVRALASKHVMVCGLGGVGSWCAEALIRSGIGTLTVVDFDRVAITNANRQMPALSMTMGELKTRVMAERLRAINPQAVIVERSVQISPETLPDLLAARPDGLVDAIDQLQHKAQLLVACLKGGINLVSSSGAGGRLDPTQVRLADLAAVTHDPLARWTRTYLRKKHGFPTAGPYRIPTVYSLETPRPSLTPSHPDAERGKQELRERGEPTEGARNVIMGTACFVTAVFGMTCASALVRSLLESEGLCP